MYNPDKITPEIKKPEKESLLPKEISDGLNEIRKNDIPFHKKAKKLASLLEKFSCKEIEILDCDVCVTDFYPEFHQKISEIYPKEFDSLSSEEQEKIHQEMFNLIPEQAKVRVHTETSAGKFTYCFGCESTMCGNSVEYPEDAKWDKIHKEKTREILLAHPKWLIDGFSLSGSTRNRICVDVISPDSEFEFHQFDIKGTHISISPISEAALKHIPQIKERFEVLKP